MNYTNQNWKILPCPINAGKHRYHDFRWIVTEGTELELPQDGSGDFTTVNGSLICKMRDVDPANARLIAAAPELLAALKEIAHSSASDCADEWEFIRAVQKIARAAIEKTEDKI
jgi:hypothetical protein